LDVGLKPFYAVILDTFGDHSISRLSSCKIWGKKGGAKLRLFIAEYQYFNMLGLDFTLIRSSSKKFADKKAK